MFSQYIGVKFGMDKCKVLTMQQGRMEYLERFKLTDDELMKEIDTGGCKSLGISQDDQISHTEMKEKLEKEYLRRVKKLVKSQLYSKNMIEGINTWAVGLCY